MTPWKRKGLYYHAHMTLYRPGSDGYVKYGSVTRTLFFISYFLIKWYHGEDKLKEMAYKMPNFFESEGK